MAGLNTIFAPDEELARGEYVSLLRTECRQFPRPFRKSPMNDVTEDAYLPRRLGPPARVAPATLASLFAGADGGPPLNFEFEQVIDLHRTLVVTGPAGRGKTSLLRWAALKALDVLEKDETAVVPVYLRLEALAKWTGGSDLGAYLRERVKKPIVFEWLWRHIETGNVLMLLDGLDEVPEGRRSAVLADQSLLWDFIRTLGAPQSRVVWTCRDSTYAAVAEAFARCDGPQDGPQEASRNGKFARLELRRLGPAEVGDFVREYFRGDWAEGTAEAFLHSIGDPEAWLAGPDYEGNGRDGRDGFLPRHAHLVTEPLYLHALCWLWAGGATDRQTPGPSRPLPLSEEDVWHEVVARLLSQRDASPSAARDPLRLTEELAFHRQFCGKAMTRAFAEEVATGLARDAHLRGPDGPGGLARRWLDDLEHWELLVPARLEDGDGYEFPVAILGAYFAARHIAARWSAGDRKYLGWLHGQARRPGPAAPSACPNRRCGAPLAPFGDLATRAEHEDTILLLAGMLGSRDREQELFRLTAPRLPLALKALGRCRHCHTDLAGPVVADAGPAAWKDSEMIDAVGALLRARLPCHADLGASLSRRLLTTLAAGVSGG